jgi:predicted transcriptional regulator
MPRPIPALPRITPRQLEILTYVFEEFSKIQTYPSKSEITRHLSVKTNNNNAVLRPLFKKGLLRNLPGRGEYELTELGVMLLKARGTRIPKSLLTEEPQEEFAEIA